MDWGFVAVNAITLACIYGTLAIGLSITWSSLGLINMAYGFIFSTSGYGAWLVAQNLTTNGAVVMAAGVITGAVGGLIVCAVAFIPIHDKPNYTLRGMIATLAISLVGTQGLLWWFGARNKSLPQLFGAWKVNIFGLIITSDKAGAVLSAIGLLTVVLMWMRASRRGLASTYTAVVRMLAWPAISAIAFRSTPRSASRVISVRRPLCEVAPAMPASP